MMRKPNIAFADLPMELSIFPLGGALLLPRGLLPLNIFEPRYLAMVDDAMRSHRLIGMIQPDPDGGLYQIGCAGRIISYTETSDGRYEVMLNGVCRFRIVSELPQKDGYRRVQPIWESYARDMEPMGCLGLDRVTFLDALKTYFDAYDLTCSWDAVEEASDEKLITCLAMICPLEPQEKQALLEAPCCKERAKLFLSILEMAVATQCGCGHKH